MFSSSSRRATPSEEQGTSLAEAQAGFRNAVTLGTLPVEVEIEYRLYLSHMLADEYEHGGQHNVQHLQDAIHHLDMVLRRLPQTSIQRPKVLCRLCYLNTSESMAVGSRFALDEAVRYGRLARDEALVHRFHENDFQSYCEILNTLGVALSYRAQGAHNLGYEDDGDAENVSTLRDLDEAIDCAREHKRLLDANHKPSCRAALNLASRLIIRGSNGSTSVTDHAEALELFMNVQQTTRNTTSEHAAASLGIGQLALVDFKRTGNIEALDAMIPSMEESISYTPEGSDMKAKFCSLLQDVYHRRYEHTRSISDLAKALQFSAQTLDNIPSSPTKANRLSAHMALLRRLALTTTSISELDEFERQAARHLGSMPRPFQTEFECRKRHNDVLVRKYLLSKGLEDLDAAIRSIDTMIHDEDGQIVLNGRRADLEIVGYHHLRRLVARLFRRPPNQAKEVACDAIFTSILRLCTPPNLWLGLLEIPLDVVELLEVYEQAASSGEVITEEIAMERARIRRETEGNRAGRGPSPPYRPPEYTTTFGLRTLAIDPRNRRIIYSLRGLMSEIYGYDTGEGVPYEQFVARHTQAEAVDAERARARGQHPNPQLCLLCRRVKPLKPIANSIENGEDAFEWNESMTPLPFGNWEQLSLRTHCSICRLVLSLIATDSETKALHPRLASVDPEIRGTGLCIGEIEDTGEAVLTVECNMTVVGHLRIVRNDDSLPSWEEFLETNLVDRVYRYGPRSGDKIDPKVLQLWLKDCELNHGRACNPTSDQPDHRYATDIPLVLIDVVNRCLVERTTASKYFALSYVWGSVDMCRTLRANYNSRCQPGGLPSQLPATIADAISLVRLMGERYLWVDALCIVQDDDDPKMTAIALMDVIYLRAFATIVALSGSDASGGLLGIRTPLKPRKREETLTIDVGSSDLDCTPASEPGTSARNHQATITLLATPQRLDLAVTASKWDMRGWTFQERLLSPRCLYFSDASVYFRCGKRVVSDGGISSRVRPKEGWWPTQEEEFPDNTLLKILRDGDIQYMKGGERIGRAFDAYKKVVEMYTKRQLTYEGDIIKAFSGVLAALNTAFTTDYWCGLPASVLDLALLWTPAEKTFRRGKDDSMPSLQTLVARQPSCAVPTDWSTVRLIFGPDEVASFDEKIDRRFPSWSWAGWKGPMDYRLFDDMSKDEPLPVSLVKEFAINLDGGELRVIRSRGHDEGTAASGSPSRGPSEAAQDEPIPEDQQYLPSPSIPNILQFLAPTLPLTAFTISPEVEYISINGAVHSSSRQAVRHVLDRRGKRCGLWWEQHGWGYVGRGISPKAEKMMVLVGVSCHEDAMTARTGPYRVEGEIRIFDDEVYPGQGPGSGMVNFVAVDLCMGHDFGERITVGRIHQKAWEEARPVIGMVRLA